MISEDARKRWEKWRADLATVAANSQLHNHVSHTEERHDDGDTVNSATTGPVSSEHHSKAANPLLAVPTPTRPLVASAADLPSETLTSNAGHTPHPSRIRSSQTFGSTNDPLEEATDPDFGHATMLDRLQHPCRLKTIRIFTLPLPRHSQFPGANDAAPQKG